MCLYACMTITWFHCFRLGELVSLGVVLCQFVNIITFSCMYKIWQADMGGDIVQNELMQREILSRINWYRERYWADETNMGEDTEQFELIQERYWAEWRDLPLLGWLIAVSYIVCWLFCVVWTWFSRWSGAHPTWLGWMARSGEYSLPHIQNVSVDWKCMECEFSHPYKLRRIKRLFHLGNVMKLILISWLMFPSVSLCIYIQIHAYIATCIHMPCCFDNAIYWSIIVFSAYFIIIVP